MESKATEARDSYYGTCGTFACSSSIHTRALPSEGARQSPRGDRQPPEEILGPLGNADRLNWLIAKNRKRKTSSHRLISLSEYARRPSVGTFSGQRPHPASDQA